MSDPMNVCSQKICDGTNPTACTSFVGASMTCVQGTCVDMIGTPPSVCNGDGGCPPVAPSSCAPYACVGGICTNSCTDTSECSPGAYCDVTSAMCVTPDGSVFDEADGGTSAAPSSKSSGCSVGGMGPSEAGALGVLMIALARIAARRRKRR
jgi:MYXO-CTERM domain-containing protein